MLMLLTVVGIRREGEGCVKRNHNLFILTDTQGIQRRSITKDAGEAKGSKVGPFDPSPNAPIPHLHIHGSCIREGVKEEHNASWFSHANKQANESREQLAHDSLEMLIQWLKDGGNVGIHGAPALISPITSILIPQSPHRRDQQHARQTVSAR
jgi:hypothetical protein